MARPRKNGIDYFPFDVFVFSDAKVQEIVNIFGTKGFTLLTFIYCEIYSSGYFVRWDNSIQTKIKTFLPSIKNDLLEAFLGHCLKLEVFSSEQFSASKVLTARRIQEQFFEIKKRSGRTVEPEKMDFWLIFDTENQKEFLCEKSPKEKKRKEKKIKDADASYKKPENGGGIFSEIFSRFQKSNPSLIQTPGHIAAFQGLLDQLGGGEEAEAKIRQGLAKLDEAKAITSGRIKFSIESFLRLETFAKLLSGYYSIRGNRSVRTSRIRPARCSSRLAGTAISCLIIS